MKIRTKNPRTTLNVKLQAGDSAEFIEVGHEPVEVTFEQGRSLVAAHDVLEEIPEPPAPEQDEAPEEAESTGVSGALRGLASRFVKKRDSQD